MKLIRILLAFALCAASSLLAQTSSVTNVSTIAKLRTLASGTSVNVQGYYAPNDGGGGIYVWNSSSTALDNGGTIIQPTGVAIGRWLLQIAGTISAKQFGAYGDNTHDDTTALQTFLTFGITNPYVKMFIPSGTYLISSEMNVAGSQGWSLQGAGKSATIIKQSATGKAAIAFKAFSWGWSITDIGFAASTQQTSSNPLAYGIRFDHNPSDGALETTYYGWKIDNCYFQNFYRNIGQSGAATTGPIPIWSFTISNCVFASTSGSSIYVNPQISNGQPNCNISNVYDAGYSGTRSEAPVFLENVNQAVIKGIDIEGSSDIYPISMAQCNASIIGMHVEGWSFTNTSSNAASGNNTLINLTQSELTIDNLDVSCTWHTGSSCTSSFIRGYQSEINVKTMSAQFSSVFDGDTNVYLFAGQSCVYTLFNYYHTAYQDSSPNIEQTGNTYYYRNAFPNLKSVSGTFGLAQDYYILTGTLTNASPTVTTGTTAYIKPGDKITGRGVPFGTTVASITNSTTFVMNQSAQINGTVSISVWPSLPSEFTFFAGSGTSAIGINAGVAIGKGADTSEGAIMMYRNAGADRNGGSMMVRARGLNPTTLRISQAATATYGSESWNDVLDVASNGLTFYSGGYLSPTSQSGIFWGNGAPSISANPGSVYQNTAGGYNSVYSKTSGTGTTVWSKMLNISSQGTFTLSSGSATVTDAAITANSVIIVTVKTVSGTRAGNPDIVPSASTGFTATGGASDNSTYNYVVIENN